MPRTKTLKKYVVISRVIVLVIVVAAIYLLFDMRTPKHIPGKLSGEFIHEHTVDPFDYETFDKRREKILGSLNGSAAIVSTDVRPDFRYVTGFPEQQGIAVLLPGDENPYRLFVVPAEIYKVMWEGEVYGIEGAKDHFGADKAYAISDFHELLPELLAGQESVYVHENDRRIHRELEKAMESTGLRADLKNLAPLLHEFRVMKDDWEVEQIRQAVDVTVKAHQYVLQVVRPGLAEYEVQAEIEYIFRRNGLGTAFSPIIGSGPNSCLLHHTRNNRVMEDGDLLLMDVGAQSTGGYSADVTRTIPVNGTFSPEQRKIYELVLKASDKAVEKMKPGYRMLDSHHLATEIMVNGLHGMGLIPDTASWWQKRFYIQHRINHYIGLQTSDAGNYGFDTGNRNEHILTPEIRGREIEPGMVMTNEPGLYFMVGLLDGIHEMFGHLASEEELNAFVEQVRPIYERFEGIGVRIEDDILITGNGNVNLSADAPRTVREIEKSMRR